MFRYIFRFSTKKALEKDYSPKDVKLMCKLIGFKKFKFNEEIDVPDQVRVLNQNNKFIGMSFVSSALQKARTLGRDLILVGELSSPKVCKIVNYIQEIEQKFFNQIVIKQRKEEIQGRKLEREIKLSRTMTEAFVKERHNEAHQLLLKNFRVKASVKTDHPEDLKVLNYFDGLFPRLPPLGQNSSQLQKYYEKSSELKLKSIKQQVLQFLVKAKKGDDESVRLVLYDSAAVTQKKSIFAQNQLTHFKKGLLQGYEQDELAHLRRRLQAQYGVDQNELQFLQDYLQQQFLYKKRLVDRLKMLIN